MHQSFPALPWLELKRISIRICEHPRDLALTHRELDFLILVQSNQIWILITLFRMILHQMEICLEPNESEILIKIKIWFDLT